MSTLYQALLKSFGGDLQPAGHVLSKEDAEQMSKNFACPLCLTACPGKPQSIVCANGHSVCQPCIETWDAHAGQTAKLCAICQQACLATPIPSVVSNGALEVVSKMAEPDNAPLPTNKRSSADVDFGEMEREAKRAFTEVMDQIKAQKKVVAEAKRLEKEQAALRKQVCMKSQ